MRSREISGHQPSEELKNEVHKRLKVAEFLQEDEGLFFGENRYEDEIHYTLLVTKVPRGDAPEEVRRAWLEVLFPYARRRSEEAPFHGFFGPLQKPEGMGFFSIKTADALRALIEGGGKNEYEAAAWFLKQPNLGLSLIFCEDECTVVKKTPLAVNRSSQNPRSN